METLVTALGPVFAAGLAIQQLLELLDSILLKKLMPEDYKKAILVVLWHELLEEDRIKELQERSEEHTSELQSPCNLVCRLLLEKNNRSRRRGGGGTAGAVLRSACRSR